jgi:hypothetical protein
MRLLRRSLQIVAKSPIKAEIKILIPTVDVSDFREEPTQND